MLFRKITPCLLFDGRANEAAEHYVSIFKKARITHRSPLATSFRIEGHDLVALNGPKASFTWGVSFYVSCRTQKEIDFYWSKLRAGGGEEQPCGWVKDKFGLSWQVIPAMLPGLLEDKDKQKADRTMQAMLKMKKLSIARLKKAHAGGAK
jgi:predicted 3-demethylubiquinone-9 3-methyltransferase (glyoxalase superfamily)